MDTAKTPGETGVTSQRAAPSAAHQPARMRKGILLVEHDAAERDTLCEQFERRAIPCWTAGNVAEALDVLHAHGAGIAVVVIEQDFPEWNGPLLWDVLHRLKPHVRGCLLMDREPDWSASQLAKIGFAAVFRKPLPLGELLRLLSELTVSCAPARQEA